jgi:hypothetical protein
MKKFALSVILFLVAMACHSTAAVKSGDVIEKSSSERMTDDQSQSVSITTTKNAQTGLTGTYRYRSALYNNTRIINNAIGVEEKGGNQLEISIAANYERKGNTGAWEVDSGSTGGIVTLKGDTAILIPANSSDCEFTLKFSGNKIIVKQKGLPFDCGLAGNTYANGTYVKTSNELNYNEMVDDVPSAGNERIRFTSGKSSAVVKGKLSSRKQKTYLIGARAGQTIEIKITDGGANHDVVFSLIAPDGVNLMGDEEGGDGYDSDWKGKLPKTGDYKIEVGAIESKNVNFKMTVTIR